jgi:Tfp pilus assembly protein PilF
MSEAFSVSEGLIYVFYSMALLSKESSLVFPVVLIVFNLLFGTGTWRRCWVMIFISAVYGIFRLTALSHIPFIVPVDADIYGRIASFFAAVPEYVRLLVMPFGLHMEYGAARYTFANIRAISGVFIFSVSILAALGLARRRPGMSFFIFWFFIFLIPYANIYPLKAYMAEHWLYVPSMGFIAVAAVFLSRIFKKIKSAAVPLIFIMAFFVFLACATVYQNRFWKDTLTFYHRVLQYSPDSKRAYNNLGLLYYERGQADDAEKYFKKSLEIDPDYPQAHNNLANAYILKGWTEEAIKHFKAAVKLKPDFGRAYYNLANTYRELGGHEEAVENYKKAIDNLPYFVKAYNNLAGVYRIMGRDEDAVDIYERIIEISPYYKMAYINLSAVYMERGEREKAREYLESAKERGLLLYKMTNDEGSDGGGPDAERGKASF